MADAVTTSTYLSGQGVLLLGDKDPADATKNTGLRPVGNVSALTLGIETTEFEHKESQTGARGIDLTLVTEISATLTMTMESIDRENLALALYGTSTAVAGSTVTDEFVGALSASWDDSLWFDLAHVKISAVTVDRVTGGAATLVEDDDYEVNYETGSIRFISGGTNTVVVGDDFLVDYTYASYENVDALTQGDAPIRWGRFEGLNTASGSNPVVVNVYRLATKPLAELALINEEIAQMEVEASVLLEPAITSGSKYFDIKYIK